MLELFFLSYFFMHSYLLLIMSVFLIYLFLLYIFSASSVTTPFVAVTVVTTASGVTVTMATAFHCYWQGY